MMKVYSNRQNYLRFLSTSSRSKEFYEEQNKLRNYFYVIDSRGQVFQEATLHRNFVTSIKDGVFLNMLFNLLRTNRTGNFMEYPLYFPCGKEHNYITIDDAYASVGFSKLITEGKKLLQVGESSIFQEFKPQQLLYCDSTGRFYHRLSFRHKYLSTGHIGLLHPQISELLSKQIQIDSKANRTSEELSFVYKDEYTNITYPIDTIRIFQRP
jgi:hypothetical protein